MVNLKNKYVRLTAVRGDRFVEFDFSIDDTEIFVELILPFDMFNTFCINNKVEILPPEINVQEEYDRMTWRIGRV